MKKTIKKMLRRSVGLTSQLKNYTENNYGEHARVTNDDSRNRLCSWQVPAIKTHFGSIEGSNFIDIGAGDIVLGEMQTEIGRPKTFFVQDLSQASISAGLERLSRRGIDISNIQPLVSEDFDFSSIDDETIDFAFSNSLFSHLSLKSILLCLRNLRPKMKYGAKYLSSMIVVPGNVEPIAYDWSYLNTWGSKVVSFATKDPYHYTSATINAALDNEAGFKVEAIHEYGHPFQKLVEFAVIS